MRRIRTGPEPGDLLGLARRAGVATMAALVLAAVSSGCHGDSPGGPTHMARSSDAPQDTATLSGVRATVVQQRIDEGTRRIGIEVSTTARTALHVVGYQLRSAGFRPVPMTSDETVFAPGQVIDLTTVYGRPRCDGQDPTEDLAAVLEVAASDGSTRTYAIPVTGSGRGVVRRLHDAECAHRRLRQAASVSYTTFTRARVAGDEALVGALDFERPGPAGSGEAVTVDSLTGSVLFDFRPLSRDKPGLVARLTGSAQRLRLPVVIESSGRCDQHARSQSTQTFLFSAYVRVGSETEHREIVVPPRLLQRQALALLDDVCRPGVPQPGS